MAAAHSRHDEGQFTQNSHETWTTTERKDTEKATQFLLLHLCLNQREWYFDNRYTCPHLREQTTIELVPGSETHFMKISVTNHVGQGTSLTVTGL